MKSVSDVGETSSIQNGNRIAWIDVTRGLLMICIIMSHCAGIPSIVHRVFFSFHVPAFFILSGYVYKKKKDEKRGVVKDIYELLVPYAIVAGIVCLCIVTQNNLDKQLFKDMIKLVVWASGTVWSDIPQMGAVWFLTAMFFARRIMGVILCTENKKIQAAFAGISVIIGIAISKNTFLPMNIDIAFVAVGLMYVGYVLRNDCQIDEFKVDACIVFGMLWIASLYMGNMSFTARNYAPYFVKLPGAIGATIIVFLFCKNIIAKVHILKKFLSFIGKHTVLLLCIHGLNLDGRNPFRPWEYYLSLVSEKWYYYGVTVLVKLVIDISTMCMVIFIITLIKKRKRNVEKSDWSKN